MKRIGECKKCGMCCEYVYITTTDRSSLDNAFIHTRNLLVINNHDGTVSLYANSPCIHYDKNSKLCKIHDIKPESCKAFPTHPYHTLRGCCSYKFEEEKDED